MEVIVLGCGPSSSIPSIRCLLTGKCAVCTEAHANQHSKNRRLNPSLLVRNLSANTNILIDCGKTFRESALRVFPDAGIENVHAVILTHGHADACLGLDDLREVQPFAETVDPTTKESKKIPMEPMRVHCSPSTREEMRGKFEYLLEKDAPESQSTDTIAVATEVKESSPPPKGTPEPFRWIAQLRFQLFQSWEPFECCGFQILPFPVIHGAGYISTGFEFGAEVGVRFIYISDVSELTPETRAFLNDSSRPHIDVLLIDALYIDKYHSTHMNLQHVLKEIRSFRPKLTLLTGMSHDFDYSMHSQMFEKLSKDEGLVIQMAYDGLRLPFPSKK